MKQSARPLVGLLATASAAALMLAGCSTPTEPTTTPPTTAPTTADTATAPPPAASSGLTIYTGRDKDEVAWVVSQFEAAFPQYAGQVQTVIAGAQDNLDRLRAEKANPQAGFLWGGTQQQFEQAAAEGLLAPYQAAHADLIADNRKDPAGMWYSEMLLPEIIIYNNQLLSADEAPQDWADLIDPKWADQIVIRDVMPSGTMRTIYAALIYQFFAQDGNPDAGYDFLLKLDANTVSYAANPDDMYQQLDSGVGTITLWNMQDALIQPMNNNRPWSYVMPASGAPILLDGVGIVANPAQQQAAQDFMDFLMEPTMQAKLATDYFQIPAMEVPDADAPQWLADMELIEMDIDWAVFGEHQDEWMTYWADNIKDKG
jgi:iron(III) transport system substrate-binding protein